MRKQTCRRQVICWTCEQGTRVLRSFEGGGVAALHLADDAVSRSLAIADNPYPRARTRGCPRGQGDHSINLGAVSWWVPEQPFWNDCRVSSGVVSRVRARQSRYAVQQGCDDRRSEGALLERFFCVKSVSAAGDVVRLSKCTPAFGIKLHLSNPDTGLNVTELLARLLKQRPCFVGFIIKSG
jgi:hypothetical protein